MKKLLIILLLSVNTGYAQTSLPVSGPISVADIALVMYNIGEISPPAYESGNFTLRDLNSSSHLEDKSAPYSISDWYGYSGTSEIKYTYNFDAFSNSVPACSSFGSANTQYSEWETLIVGSSLYSDIGLSTPSANGEYRIGEKVYVVAYGSGIISSIYYCTPANSVQVYRGTGDDYTISGACSLGGTIYTLYYTGSLEVGTILYRDSGLTLPAYCQMYKTVADDQYIIIHSTTGCSGVTSPTGAGGPPGSIRLIGDCP